MQIFLAIVNVTNLHFREITNNAYKNRGYYTT